jgi:DNA-binding NarL/FixJ family response regulator
MSDNTKHFKALLVDDDPVLLSLLRLKLKRACPNLTIAQSQVPELIPGFDVYVIDNDFYGARSGAKLAERIRTQSPNAQVYVFSSCLDVPLLKRVANVGANGVFDKREQADIERLIDIIASHCENAAEPIEPMRRNLIADITAMLRAWNRKLAREEQVRVQ